MSTETQVREPYEVKILNETFRVLPERIEWHIGGRWQDLSMWSHSHAAAIHRIAKLEEERERVREMIGRVCANHVHPHLDELRAYLREA